FPDLAIKLTTARTTDLLRRVAGDELDLVIVASSGPPPVARATRVGAYDLQFWGCADRFAALASATTDDEVARFPLVEIESLPGQPTMIPDDASTYGVANSLASVKALVMAGFGVGAMLGFMLDPTERARLVSAAVPHDPDCALYVGASPHWSGATELAIEAQLVDTLAGVYPSGAQLG
ncbi:MAG: LysR substrate-binding domain-containing protein, partial [Myxococcota bacterium]|nr:LysR substrate-binding domain-containing protein [Myxococcota bacterium]